MSDALVAAREALAQIEQALAQAPGDAPVEFWWRDDDAIAETPRLHQLMTLSETLGIPVGLAVIPDQLKKSLAPVVRNTPRLMSSRMVGSTPTTRRRADRRRSFIHRGRQRV
ncbi:MAG TPA: hypothetical protein VHL34_07195 [Rhizomicrobium sp.]|nr:hypothetical protein [Rhizomicrobium sp.]